MDRGGYVQFCPVSMAAEIFCSRWTPLILRELLAGTSRFNDLRRGVPRMSPALLSKRLKELEAQNKKALDTEGALAKSAEDSKKKEQDAVAADLEEKVRAAEANLKYWKQWAKLWGMK